MTGEVEITQEHLDLVRRVADRLVGESGVARMVGFDELESEGMVLLWLLAEEFDAELGVPFEVFIKIRLKYRMIDWLRATYGRTLKDGSMPPKRRITLMTTSLDDHHDEEGFSAERDSFLVDPTPPVEDQVESRMQLERLLKLADELTPKAQAALFWPLWYSRLPGGRRLEHPREEPTPRQTAASLRVLTKRRAYRVIDRPPQWRRFRTHERASV